MQIVSPELYTPCTYKCLFRWRFLEKMPVIELHATTFLVRALSKISLGRKHSSIPWFSVPHLYTVDSSQ